MPIDTDRYGRTVAFVWIKDQCVSKAMVEQGAAWFYDEYSNSPDLFEVEDLARAARRGLWSLPVKDRVEPWAWRREKR